MAKSRCNAQPSRVSVVLLASEALAMAPTVTPTPAPIICSERHVNPLRSQAAAGGVVWRSHDEKLLVLRIRRLRHRGQSRSALSLIGALPPGVTEQQQCAGEIPSHSLPDRFDATMDGQPRLLGVARVSVFSSSGAASGAARALSAGGFRRFLEGFLLRF